jgi:magnesium chelatase family protein
MLPEGGLVRTRPFRDPHSSASLPALIGGGHRIKPGEISLAHHGVLFLDEFPEFARATLESLRAPLETGQTLVARANQHVTYPARFQLIAAMNPCRCGHLGEPDLECTKAPRCGADYQSKISGPMMDRIDMQVDVPPVRVSDLAGGGSGEKSAVVAARVAAVRAIQEERLRALDPALPVALNAYIDGKALESIAPLESDARALLNQAMERARLSARAYYRVLRVARTIADLGAIGHENQAKAGSALQKAHIAEALSYRRTALG